DIARGLMTHGRAASTPVGIVQNGARATQKVLTTTLGDLLQRPPANVARPACVIVGEVVALHNELAWFDPLPPTGPAPSARAAATMPAAPLLSTGNAS
ncbi:MAG: siroheme synthase, partial [Gammaproteobacteria bacterium]